MAEPLPEQFGRYTIIKRLGQGGMGSVYLAEDTQLGRRVALKVPDFGPHEGPEARKRFLDEARTAATLDHPYLCPVHDAGEIGGNLFLTMAYIEGQSLAALIGNEGWPERQVAALVGKLALAMQESHAKKVIHRDLKPANVMIKTTGQRREPVIVDFGLAHRDNPEEQRLTRSGQIMGTLGYMAPEQIRGDLKAIGPACDIYALGVILYELLTGRLPFSGSGLAVAAQILTVTPPPPATFRSDLDPALEAICLKAMAKQVGDRYASMGELAAALTGFLRSPTATPTPTAPAGSPAPPSPTRGKTAQQAGSNSLVRQFLDQLGANNASPPPVPTAEPVPFPAPLPERRRPRWPLVVAAGVLGVLLLGAIFVVRRGNNKPLHSGPEPTRNTLVTTPRPKPWSSVPELAFEAPKVGFQPLFNGKDLTGWKVHPNQPGNWHVTDGVLVGSGSALSHLYTERGDFTDFHLRVEARFNKGGNSGLYFRCPFGPGMPDDDPKWPDGYEATINNARIVPNSTGGLYPGVGNDVFIADFGKVTSVPFGQWFTLEVIAQGNALAALVNGKSSAYKIAHKRLYASGHIALQQYSPETVIEFRTIDIKELNRSDQKDSKEIRHFLGARDRVAQVAFSPDGLGILSGESAIEQACALSFSSDDRRVMAATTIGRVVVWDLAAEQELPPLTLEAGPIKQGEFPCAAFSSDRQHLVTGSRTGTVELWDLQGGKRLQTFTGHAGAVHSVACSADGRLILSCGSDNTVRLWDVASGNELEQLKSDDRQVLCVAFSPDSRRALSAGGDGPVHLWDLQSGKEVCRMEGHTMGVNSVAFSPDGRRAVSGSDDRTVRLWQLPEWNVAGGTPSNTH